MKSTTMKAMVMRRIKMMKSMKVMQKPRMKVMMNPRMKMMLNPRMKTGKDLEKEKIREKTKRSLRRINIQNT